MSGFVAQFDEILVVTAHFTATLFVPLNPNVFQFIEIATFAHFLRNFYYNKRAIKRKVFFFLNYYAAPLIHREMKAVFLFTRIETQSTISRIGKGTDFSRTVNLFHCVNCFAILNMLTFILLHHHNESGNLHNALPVSVYLL